jgi:hypothetical protein
MSNELPPLPIHRLEHIIAAFRGLARVIDPEPSLDSEDRNNLYFLLMLLTDHLEGCLQELVHDRHALRSALWRAEEAGPGPEETRP